MSHGTLPDGCQYEDQEFVYGTLVGFIVEPRSDSHAYPAHSLWRCRRCGVVRASFNYVSVVPSDYDAGRFVAVGGLKDIL